MGTSAVLRYPRRRRPWRLVSFPLDLRIGDRPPPPLDTNVVQRPPPPIPAALSSRSRQAARTLGAGARRPWLTMQHRRLRDPSRVLQGVETTSHLHGHSHGPGSDVTTAPLHDRHHRDTPGMAPDIREVRTPHLMHSGKWPTPSSRGIHALSWLRLAGTGCGLARLQSHRGQPPGHPFGVDPGPWLASPGGHPAHALQGGPRLLCSEHAHAREVFQPLRCGPLVKPGP
jgi:hypothetical protein